MPLYQRYRDYFDIDPDYFPAVNVDVINTHPDMWKKFYPHKAFVELLKTAVDALDRKKRLSIWVEGAYGTGKSYAVLTLKKLIEASADEAKGYFADYGLDMDLYNSLQRIKDSGKVLTVHRYGSSGIEGDSDLVLAVQESVERALADAGIENRAKETLKSAVIKWLSDDDNKKVFNIYAKDTFGGDDADAVLQKLATYQGEPLLELMEKVFGVARERNILAFKMSASDLCDWLKEVISANGLKAIVFIWDEFTEFFKRNARSLTGFQEICELSETQPFYLIIVTHASSALFSEGDQDFKKINDRFVKPHCQISLPETIAFQLMGAAMQKSADEAVLADWRGIVDDLARRTRESRKLVENAAKIADKEMLDILPIHPFAALLLKHIATAFESNQRSMFDFIKNDSGDDAGGGFQWFIDNCGPSGDNPLLTVDLLWDFFYEKGRDFLAPDIRAILDYFNKSACQARVSDDKRVIKTVLLMQAISQRTGDAVDLFIATEKNIDLAFEGTDLEDGAGRIANRLSENTYANGDYRENVLFRRKLKGGEFQYIASINDISEDELKKIKEEIDKKPTTALVTEDIGGAAVAEAVTSQLEGAMKLRYDLRVAAASDFDQVTRPLRYREAGQDGKILAVACFAKDQKEADFLSKKIAAALNDGDFHLVFIDATGTPFGNAFDTYKNELARAIYLSGKDNGEAKQHANRAREEQKKWARRISTGGLTVFSEQHPSGERAPTQDALIGALKAIDRKIFPSCLECEYNVLPTMYTPSTLRLGVECGAKRETKGVYRSGNANTKLETALKDAWDDPNYWKTRRHLLISQIKIAVDDKIKEGFMHDGRASIRSVYEMLKAQPYGFMPCNLTAFVMGFVLREYVGGPYSWSDGTTSSELTLEKLKEMVGEVISLQITPNSHYADKYIVEMSDADRAFNEITAAAFGIPLELCTSIEKTRERIRAKMKELSFPIWTVKDVLPDMELKTERAVLEELIDSYREIANNTSEDKSEKGIARAIGELSLKNPDAKEDLKKALTAENCTNGMRKYAAEFEGGELASLAEKVGDGGQYINALRSKFSPSDAANWLWNVETAQERIRDTILDYRIIAESNKIIAKTASLDGAIREWCNKCGLIRVSYPAAKGYLGGIEPLIGMLYSIKQAGSIREGQKQEFLDRLVAHGDEFNAFLGNQLELFKKVCAHYVDGLSDEDARGLFDTIPAGAFTQDQSEYLNLVGKKANEYRGSLKSERLKSLWREKTGTASPRQWSRERLMPILALVPDGEVQEARAAFDAVNAGHPDATATERALFYLERASFYDAMKNSQELDRIFTASIIKDNAVMLPDVGEVKEYLSERIGAEPYDWFALPEIEKRLKQMAEAKYSSGGYARALEKIDGMPVDEVKRYLKELIRNNMTVGMEIIKEN